MPTAACCLGAVIDFLCASKQLIMMSMMTMMLLLMMTMLRWRFFAVRKGDGWWVGKGVRGR